ncbi:hypothetical protein OKW42_003349 [Paraburkholderia sp. WC7.3d]
MHTIFKPRMAFDKDMRGQVRVEHAALSLPGLKPEASRAFGWMERCKKRTT